jgi:hypothetical protein
LLTAWEGSSGTGAYQKHEFLAEKVPAFEGSSQFIEKQIVVGVDGELTPPYFGFLQNFFLSP